jgi:L-ribulose-5-phosphate 3-epimerase
MTTISRRDFARTTVAVASALAITPARADSPDDPAGRSASLGSSDTAAATRPFCFFSKHLPDLNWADLATAVVDMGYDGVDLTVRPGGHVAPERAAADLPRAVDAIRAKGTAVRMITTGLTAAADPTARPILQAAGKAGVRLVKPGYWKYALVDVRAEIAAMIRDVTDLAALARDCGVELGVHNHTGNVGGGIWDIAPHMDTLDARAVGYYFDPRHAVVEGGGAGWKTATLLVAPRLKMMAVKDFFWARQAGAWKIQDCPLGEGMVDWPWFTKAINQTTFAGPISVHFEYTIPGATPDEVRRNTIAAGRRDLAFIRAQFDAAHTSASRG